MLQPMWSKWGGHNLATEQHLQVKLSKPTSFLLLLTSNAQYCLSDRIFKHLKKNLDMYQCGLQSYYHMVLGWYTMDSVWSGKRSVENKKMPDLLSIQPKIHSKVLFFTSTTDNWCADGFNVLFKKIFSLCMKSRAFCLSSEFPRLFRVRASLLFLLWNWPSQLLASMLLSCKFLQLVLITGVYLSNRMCIMAEE